MSNRERGAVNYTVKVTLDRGSCDTGSRVDLSCHQEPVPTLQATPLSMLAVYSHSGTWDLTISRAENTATDAKMDTEM